MYFELDASLHNGRHYTGDIAELAFSLPSDRLLPPN